MYANAIDKSSKWFKIKQNLLIKHNMLYDEVKDVNIKNNDQFISKVLPINIERPD